MGERRGWYMFLKRNAGNCSDAEEFKMHTLLRFVRLLQQMASKGATPALDPCAFVHFF